jgi:hypothetical protein
MKRFITDWFVLTATALLAFACSAASSSDLDPGVAASGGGRSGDGGGKSDGAGSGIGGGINLGGSGGTTTQSGGASGAPPSGGASCGQPPGDQMVPEACGDGLDNDLNGFVDEGCPCTIGATQACFGGLPSQASAPCSMGTQQCTGTPEFHGFGKCTGWQCGPVTQDEICGNGVDDDCDGLVDEGCGITMPVNLDGDCLFAACPPQAPYPIGCNIVMEGGDSRGCVSVAPGGGVVYFQEGDACPIFGIGDAGHVSGQLLCSSVPGAPLDDNNCPITTKSTHYYPTSGGPPRFGCP